MGKEINLFDMYPKTERDVEKRWKEVTIKDRLLARQFEKDFFDGTRNQGYGGYKYYPKYTEPIIRRIKEYYGLTNKSRILDVGSGKGFLLHEFKKQIPEITVAGIEISEYGVNHTMSDVKPFVTLGNAKSLPYADKTFDLVLAINTIHNLPLEDCFKSLQEIERVSRKDKYIIVDAWKTEKDRERMFKWVLTGITYFSTDKWKELFKLAGYTGDYYWFIA
jgi:SAM-dependent methyltransferase